MPTNLPAFSNATTGSVLAMTRLRHIFLAMFMFLLPILCEWLANAYRIARRLSRSSIRKRRQQSVARQGHKAYQSLKLTTHSVPDVADALCHAMAVLLASVRGAVNPDANMLCYTSFTLSCVDTRSFAGPQSLRICTKGQSTRMQNTTCCQASKLAVRSCHAPFVQWDGRHVPFVHTHAQWSAATQALGEQSTHSSASGIRSWGRR